MTTNLKRIRCIRQRGTALIYICLLFSILLLTIGFAVDLNLTSSAKTQYQYAANASSLLAMRTFAETMLTSTQATEALKMVEAYAAAEQAVSTALSNTLPSGLTGKFSVSRTFSAAAQLTGVGTAATPDRAAYIVPGRWWISTPPAGCASIAGGSCKCDASDKIKTPCFEPIRSSERATSFKVQVRTTEASRIVSLFMRTFGNYSSAVQAEATAILIPRRGVFLFDVSPSVVADSHPNQDYALFADPSRHPGCDNTLPDGTAAGIWNTWLTGSPELPGTDLFKYNAINARGLQANYRCTSAPNTSDEASYNGTVPVADEPFWSDQIYLVDHVVAPEPLTSILGGIHTALEQFNLRSVRGDAVGVFAFDDSILPSRATTKDVNGTKYPAMITPNLSNPQFLSVFNATDVGARSLQERLNEKFFLPRLLGSHYDDINIPPDPAARRGAMTDLELALTSAAEMLQFGEALGGRPAGSLAADPTFSISDNFIMLFTDGLTSCANGSCDYQTIDTDSNGINQATDWFNAGFARVTSILSSTYANNKIAVYISLSGENVKPNNSVRKDPATNTCLTQERLAQIFDIAAQQALTRAGAYTKNLVEELFWADWWGNYTDVTRPNFDIVNKLARFTRPSGGLWMPLRPPCPPLQGDASGAACKAGNLMQALDAQCAALIPKNSWDNSDFPIMYSGSDLSASRLLTTGPSVAGFNANSNSGRPYQYVGIHGELQCDPYCRNKNEQVQDYIKNLFTQSPYQLVE